MGASHPRLARYSTHENTHTRTSTSPPYTHTHLSHKRAELAVCSPRRPRPENRQSKERGNKKKNIQIVSVRTPFRAPSAGAWIMVHEQLSSDSYKQGVHVLEEWLYIPKISTYSSTQFAKYYPTLWMRSFWIVAAVVPHLGHQAFPCSGAKPDMTARSK